VDDADPDDQYARLYRPKIVRTVNGLHLPRYGLGQYVDDHPALPPSKTEEEQLANLSRAGKRLMGFCRTNLFKRLESSGFVFIQSVERHVLRNFVFLHAIEAGEDLPIGTQGAELLDARVNDEDEELGILDETANGVAEGTPGSELGTQRPLRSEADFRDAARAAYEQYRGSHRKRFGWLRPSLFAPDLAKHLAEDAKALLGILASCGAWDPAGDTKLDALCDLITERHPDEKVLVFTQFADTVSYLATELSRRGVTRVTGVSGQSEGIVDAVGRFSPDSNDRKCGPDDELRVLVATDVLSEGLNLQDAHVVVNYDLPWAIIRLVQRAGRVDRIGQKAEEILCYTFWTADGVERILNLRRTVRQRLDENREVVGTDEAFFEDDRDVQGLRDLYTEKAGVLDGEDDTEVDLASYAYQIWRNATAEDPQLRKTIEELPSVVYSMRAQPGTPQHPHGALVYLKTGEGNDALAWLDEQGEAVTHSQLRILQAAQCEPDTPAAPRTERHHELVRAAVTHIAELEKTSGGQLGRPSGARFRTYERLKRFAHTVTEDLFWSRERIGELERTIDDVYRSPLHESAKDTINRQLKAGISDDQLADLALALREEGRLCVVHEDGRVQEPHIICSLGLVAGESEDSTCQ